jgi:hypothetical protein
MLKTISTSLNHIKLKHVMVFAAFAACQLLGVFLPRLTNIHSEIWPAFALLLLMPGIVLIGFIDNFRLAASDYRKRSGLLRGSSGDRVKTDACRSF